MLENLTNHKYLLIKTVVVKYLKIQINYIAKTKSTKSDIVGPTL